ncbi:hypothetical protein Vadar_009629 [Vaccinium darrowii]|uniref:Uncharacterized protein n=1 Tax=Vaccinium darrowii TaxID=229202 RepID=A0ACB7YDT6_9ERIC|nr:hypothetical protein Vadar_009629 [Vaccinium darrowii]
MGPLVMGLTKPSKLSKKKLISFTFCSIALFAGATLYSLSSTEQLPENNPGTIANSSSSSSSSSPSKEEAAKAQIACDYNNGKWVPDKLGPMYNGTSCGVITNYQLHGSWEA